MLVNQRLFKHIKPKEADITREIRAYLRLKRVFHFKQWQGLGSYPGVSDILGIWRGKFLAIEVKTDRGTLSDKQREFIERIKIEGGIAFVARSVEDVMEALSDGNSTEFKQNRVSNTSAVRI